VFSIELLLLTENGHRLAVNYLFMTNHGSNEHPELAVQPFDASTELNDYEVSHDFFFPLSLSHLAPHSFIHSTL
jgi:hypothetical protein